MVPPGNAGANPRYALYFAPVQDTELWSLGCRWLGRDAATDDACIPPLVDGLTPERQSEITATARAYGFHATLKPPFHLAHGYTVEDVKEGTQRLAATLLPFDIPGLEIASLNEFLALRPTTAGPELDDLAAKCVAELDHFRRPPTSAELAKRRQAGLSAIQESHLQRWGYPYVMDEFRFHMTLTERLDAQERSIVMAGLDPLFAPCLARPVACREIALFAQPAPGATFRLVSRYPLGSI